MVTGIILTDDSKSVLVDASIVLLSPRNPSTISYSALSDSSGRFLIRQVAIGDFPIMIKYVGYQPYMSIVKVTPTSTEINIGKVYLKRSSIVLKQIEIVQDKPRISLRKDTIEFNASYYQTKETDPMRELLRKLPGVEFSPDGTITVNGQVVNQIMIDGRPFFGKDTKIASNNLLSGIIKSIQIIDRKPDSQEMGASNSGQTEKAINITLKDDHYGKITGLFSAAGGIDEKYSAKTSINKFDKHRQLSFIANGDNINGLDSYADNSNGIKTTGIFGFNYNQDWSDRLSVNGSYYFGNIKSELATNSLRQNILPDMMTEYAQNSLVTENWTTHAMEAGLTYKLDSLNSFQLISRTSISLKNSLFKNSYTTSDLQKTLNSGTSKNVFEDNSIYNFNSIGYARKFRRVGQQFKLDFGFAYGHKVGSQVNHSNTDFSGVSDPVQLDTLDQHRSLLDQSPATQLTISYTHPLSATTSLNLEFRNNQAHTSSSRMVNDQDKFSHLYTIPVDSLSGVIRSKINMNKGIFCFQIAKPTFDLSFGANLQIYKQDVSNIGIQPAYRKSFVYFLPIVDFRYKLKRNAFLHLGYDGKVSPPNVDQLVQLPDNTNPLYISQGNPQLRPSLTHYVNADYRKINSRNGSTFFSSAYFGLIDHQLVNSIFMDSIGRQVSKPVNVLGAWFTGSFVSLSMPLKAKGMTLGTNNAVAVINDYSFINEQRNRINRLNINQRIYINYSINANAEFSLVAGIAYSHVKYSLQPASRTTYLDYNFSLEGRVTTIWGIELQTNSKYYLATGREAGYNIDRLIINLSATKSVLSNGRGLFKVQVFDLLNKNVNYLRNVGDGYIEDVQTNSLKRILMFGFVYNLKQRMGSDSK